MPRTRKTLVEDEILETEDTEETTETAEKKSKGFSLFETRRYRLTGISPILGTKPANENIRTAFVTEKAPTPDAKKEELDLYELDSEQDKGLTVFARDPDNGDCLILLDYMVRGFFKAAFAALSSQLNIKAHKSKVDKYLFVAPRRIPLLRDGEPIYDEDDEFERPLRCETMKGPRVALQGSEQIYDPWQIEFELRLVPNSKSASSAAVTWEAVENALEYGQLCGLGQFRNGSYGKFTWERID